MKYFDLLILLLLSMYFLYNIGTCFYKKSTIIKDDMFEFIHPASLR